MFSLAVHNSAFYGVGKKTIVNRVQKSEEAHKLIASRGMQLPVTEEVISDLERFVIKYTSSVTPEIQL